MGLAAGRLNRRVEIIRPVVADDGHGGQIETWQSVTTVWAEAISQNGREAVLAGSLQGVASWRITMRYRPDVTTEYQLKLDGKLLNVRAADDPDGRREQLVIFADTASVSQ